MSVVRLFLKRQMPTRALDEVQLLHAARHAYPELVLADLSHARLAALVRAHDVDFATALLYDRLGRDPHHGPFIARVAAREPLPSALPHIRGRLLLAPAIFHAELPAYGGDGLLIRQVAAQFGLESSLFPVPSGGSIREAVPLVQATLAAQPDDSVILVSLSKGSADIRLALEEAPHLARKVRGWLQICGLIHGFPTLNVYLRQSRLRPLWWLVLRAYFRLMGANLAMAHDLMHGPGTLLHSPPALPGEFPLFTVLGFPLQSHLTGTLRARHRQLAPLGPNDGYMLLRDGLTLRGHVYPVWSANHYFRFPGAARLLYQLFLELADQLAQE